MNTIVILLLLLITETDTCSKKYFDEHNNTGACASSALETVWRFQYALAIPVLAWLLWMRFYRLRESTIWERRYRLLSAMDPRELKAKRWRDTKELLFSSKYLKRLIG